MSKERLEEIKQYYSKMSALDPGTQEDILWLIEQAERLEELENDNTITMTLEQYGKLLGKANRVQELEEELGIYKNIARNNKRTGEFMLHEINKENRKLIKENEFFKRKKITPQETK